MPGARYCFLCNNYTGFFVWSTSRNFPKESLVLSKNIKNKIYLKLINNTGVPICFNCLKELKKIHE